MTTMQCLVSKMAQDVVLKSGQARKSLIKDQKKRNESASDSNTFEKL